MEQDTNQVWMRVFDGMAELAQSSWPSEGQVGQLNSLLGSVHMIQPFNWNAWEAPLPQLHEIWGLSADDCVKHVTRLSRADRTNEGVLWSALHGGALTLFCMVARLRCARGIPESLPKAGA